MDQSGLKWTNIDKSGPYWTKVNQSRLKWTIMDQSETGLQAALIIHIKAQNGKNGSKFNKMVLKLDLKNVSKIDLGLRHLLARASSFIVDQSRLILVQKRPKWTIMDHDEP